MYGVVGIVVDSGHSTYVVESLDKHSLGIKVGEAQGAVHLMHPTCLTPLLYGREQCIDHLSIVHKVDPSEADGLLSPSRIGLMIDDGYDTAYYLVLTQGNEGLSLTKLEGCILLRVKGVAHIGI